MKENFEVNLDNFTQEEKENFLKLVKIAQNRAILEPIGKRWRGKKNDIYYSITGNGCSVNTIESETTYDNVYYEFGNYFKTKEEAEFARKKQYVYQKLKDYALEHNVEAIDWSNEYSSKFCIAYDYHNDKLFIDDMQTVKYPNTIYFTSEKIAENAIKEIGEEVIKYYLFGI